MQILDINNLNLHDATLLEIKICTDLEEMIELKFDSINHKQAGKTVCKVLRFKRCFWFSSNLNFNYASPNFIQDGIGKSDSQQIDSVRLNWKKMGVTLAYGASPLHHQHKHNRKSHRDNCGTVGIGMSLCRISEQTKMSAPPNNPPLINNRCRLSPQSGDGRLAGRQAKRSPRISAQLQSRP